MCAVVAVVIVIEGATVVSIHVSPARVCHRTAQGDSDGELLTTRRGAWDSRPADCHYTVVNTPLRG